ncbi:MAG: Rrf2 family transcriptional regulator [Candidatus Neomarinimicrobiota bacterium]|nr:MAG: Rrf2 family transcriptional regulator [Candidatus Neomarinimicrobiota bacterium]
MLKLTRKVEYALMAMQYMQHKPPEQITKAKEIAERYAIPRPLLAKILQQLARERVVEPVQGPNGGYRLSMALNTLSLARFVEMLEGPLGLVDCNLDAACDQLTQCNIRQPIQRVNNTIKAVFANLTLDQITQ